MIQMIRVDDRLIHGQVALLWTKELQIDRIIVANDLAAKNDIQKNALHLAAPTGVKVAVVPVSHAVKMANDPRAKALKILIVVNNVSDLLTLTTGIAEPGKVDIANVGRVQGGLKDKRKLSDTVYLSDADIDKVKQIAAQTDNLVYQPLPSDTATPFLKLLEGDN
ncbi:hypothetical protein BVJ53_07490 [Lacticaseibacillus chiayiensis]|uniref:PTS EIIB type-4 domain-containing protein n=2 Tax=Lacticaseibacillus chiayiensis TaxID=2100821 RepID=A0A4Q1TZG6_9LACO|nr:hypothetical protein BVJ53_07490 [Lacticaseibacillus chiayiensis]RXT58012.1 hypothetical protein CHT97_09035 [Lacticaseibacillus chiayiensis]